MRLLPQEQDRLLLFLAAELARARRARGLRLNQAEAAAIVGAGVCERARDGLRYADVVVRAYALLGEDDVLDGVRELVPRIEVEAVFRDGRHIVVLEDPLGAGPSSADGRDLVVFEDPLGPCPDAGAAEHEPGAPWLQDATTRLTVINDG